MIPLILLFVAGLLLRAYKVSRDPLWFDELYGYQLGELGPAAIIRNTRYVPHPPLFYLLQWVASGFGSSQTEWGWRWLSVVSGAAAIPVLFLVAWQLASYWPAVLSSLLFAVAPASVYFSQEARPYALLILISVASAWLIGKIHQRPHSWWPWITLTFLSITGFWLSYSYLLIMGMQVVCLMFVFHLARRTLLFAIALAVGCAPLVALAAATLSGTEERLKHTSTVTITSLMQMLLAGDRLRYGINWPHLWIPPMLVLLMCAGLWSMLRRTDRLVTYHGLQVVLPLAGFFLVGVAILGIGLPDFEWKQFVVLMPSIFVLIALGLQQIQRSLRGRLGASIVCAVCLFVSGASLVNVKRMWSITKSPEGLAVQYVRSNLHQDDAILSLHYSLNAAASFYLKGEPLFTDPLRTGEDILFSRTPSVLYDLAPIQRSASLANLGSYARIWVLSRANQPPPVEQALIRECTTIQQQDFTPFRVVLLGDCHLERAGP